MKTNVPYVKEMVKTENLSFLSNTGTQWSCFRFSFFQEALSSDTNLFQV